MVLPLLLLLQLLLLLTHEGREFVCMARFLGKRASRSRKERQMGNIQSDD